jgi:radical SAM superfamily enzyme YgiQ (UPF0313 family)
MIREERLLAVANVVLMKIFGGLNISAGTLSAVLEAHGHRCLTIYFKEYVCRPSTALDDVEVADNCVFIVGKGRDALTNCYKPITDKEIQLLFDVFREFKPDLVGFSLVTQMLPAAAKLSNLIREQFDVPIVWGGMGPTIEPERCLRDADIVCLGEGDGAMLDLADAVDRGEIQPDIENLWVKRNGHIRKNPVRPLIQDLDALASPSYDPHNIIFINENALRRNTYLPNMAGLYPIMTSRGCPFACYFCSNDLCRKMYKGQKYVRRRSPENVIEELKRAMAIHDLEWVLFYDDVFVFDKGWVSRFAEMYKSEIGLPFWCYSYPTFTDEETFRILRDCGLKCVTCGIQTGSQRILRELFNRPTSREKILEAGRTFSRLGIDCYYDLITSIPGETEEDCRETLDLLLAMPRPFKVMLGINELVLYPGYEVTRIVEERNLSGQRDEKMTSFYNRLYLMCETRIPGFAIRALSRIGFLRNHPRLLEVLLPANASFPAFMAGGIAASLEE